ncbi:MAG TPA: hypothetical protein VK335_11265 [Bryobacteraceae bacterium]|nr:hypothetical protein [Bryobacteraceae bacterium]
MQGQRFSEYCRLVLSQFWKDIRPRFEWAIIALFVATIGALLLDHFQLVPSGQTFLRILAPALPTILILFLYVIPHAARAPWKIYREAIQRHTAECNELQAQIAQLQDRLSVTAQQLEVPLIEPNIMGHSVMESNAEERLADFSAALGFLAADDKDTLFKVRLRLENKHRQAAIVEHLWIELQANGHSEKYPKIASPERWPNKEAARHHADTLLDEDPFVEYGVPHVGYVYFKASNRAITTLVRKSFVVCIRDGTGRVTRSNEVEVSV